MREFFQEYGFVILAGIVLLVLIVMCTPLRSIVGNAIDKVIDTFSEKETQEYNGTYKIGDTASLLYLNGKPTLKIKTGNSTNIFEYQVLYTKNNQQTKSSVVSTKDLSLTQLEDCYYIDIEITEVPDKNSSMQIKVINTGTNETFYSNKLTYKDVEYIAGKIIELEGENYIVLKQIDNSQYLVLRQDPIKVSSDKSLSTLKGEDDTSIIYSLKNSNVYTNSNLGTYLENNYYQLLSFEMQNAIIPIALTQDYRTFSSGQNNNGAVKKSVSIGVRHVFLPSVKEILSAVPGATQKDGSVPESFLKDSSGTMHHYWLRDADADKANYVFRVIHIGMNRISSYLSNKIDISVRPAFVIDLSKINYTDTGKTYITYFD